MYGFTQLFKRDFLNLFFNPMWTLNTLFFPYLLILILGFLSSGNYGNSVTSYDYYGVSMLVFSACNSTMIASNSFMEERIKKGNMRIIYSSLPTSNIYISKIAATFVFSSFWHLIVMLLLKLTLNVNFGGGNIGYIVLLMIILEFFSSALGVLFCCIFKSEKTANTILSLLINIFGILGGVFFRLDGFGKALENISLLSPLKWIITNAFIIIYDKDFSYYVPTTLSLALLCVLILLLCGKFYKSEDYV